jgi:hypothetical protein
MKKQNNADKPASAKKSAKQREADELRKPVKLKPLKEKEKKNWKNNFDDEEEDFPMDDDLKLDSFDDEGLYEEDDF